MHILFTHRTCHSRARSFVTLSTQEGAPDFSEEAVCASLPGARCFEQYEQNFGGKAALAVAIEYAQALGLDRISARVRALASRLRLALTSIEGVKVADVGHELCAIVTFVVRDRDAQIVRSEMHSRGVEACVSMNEGHSCEASAPGTPSMSATAQHWASLPHTASHAARHCAPQFERTRETHDIRTRLEPPKQCPVKFIFDFIQCPLAGQQFFNICELIFLCSYSFHFFFDFFFCLCSYSFKIFRIIYLCSYSFFLPELILHKYSVEGYLSDPLSHGLFLGGDFNLLSGHDSPRSTVTGLLVTKGSGKAGGPRGFSGIRSLLLEVDSEEESPVLLHDLIAQQAQSCNECHTTSRHVQGPKIPRRS